MNPDRNLNATIALSILDELDPDPHATPAERIAEAQAYATLALVEELAMLTDAAECQVFGSVVKR